MAALLNPIKLTLGAIGFALEVTESARSVAFRTTRSVGELAVRSLRPERDENNVEEPEPRPMPTVPYGVPLARPERSAEEPPVPLPAEQLPSRPLTRRKASTPQRRAPSRESRARAHSKGHDADLDRAGADRVPDSAKADGRHAAARQAQGGADAFGQEPSVEDGNANAPAEEQRHVDAGTAIVLESADPGAQDGAGAAVHVEQPWKGYSKMRAPEVIDRLAAQPEAAISVVLLYERSHRARRSVLDAAARELKARVPASASRAS